MDCNISFIGAGNMGGALVRTVCKAVKPEAVYVYRRNRAALEELAGETGCAICTSVPEAAEAGKYIFLCVKPHMIGDILEEISPKLKEGAQAGEEKVIISIAAGVTLRAMQKALRDQGLKLPVYRLMPNTPISLGAGVMVLAPGKYAAQETTKDLEAMLRPGGLVETVDEATLALGSAIFGSGPAFAYMFIEALADGGVQIGLPRQKAMEYAAQTLIGAGEMVLRSGKHPGQLKDEVCSPGGSTIAGVSALEQAGFRGAAASAVAATNKRNGELGQG